MSPVEVGGTVPAPRRHAAGAAILALGDEAATQVVDALYAARPEMAARYGPAGREKCRQDMRYHLAFLAESVSAEAPALFADYASWAKVMLATRGLPAADLAETLGELTAFLRGRLGAAQAAAVEACIGAARAALDLTPDDLPSGIADDAPHAALARAYLDALLQGQRQRAARLVLDAVDGGVPVRDVYLHVFQVAQREIGRLWQTNRVSVAQEHYCTAATQLVMSQLYPRIFVGPRRDRAMVATCVSGDLHELGIRMVADLFELEGWDTHYLGASVPAEGVVQTVRDRHAQVLAISATLTMHVPQVVGLIEAVRAADLGAPLVVMVGGYPFNVAPDLWRRVGADGSAPDAGAAPALADRLLAQQSG